MSQTKLELRDKVYELLKDAEIELDFSSINVLEAANLILDNHFGDGFSKNNPKEVLKFVESLMSNIRAKSISQTIISCTKEAFLN